jgi:DNA (cytosine-5)-methyltransferase 1
MRIGSLFSGAGGLDMAVQEVFDGEVTWHSEIDKAASKVLAYRFPGVPNLGDITAIDWNTVEPIDILCGGFPCTDVSAAGKRAGMHGTRSGLWTEFAKAIDNLRPRMVVIENVRGLLSAHANRPMESDDVSLGDGGTVPVLRAAGAVLGDLADLGYDAAWTTFAAGDVGAPHRRERVFILATSNAPSYGWDEGRPEPARIVGGFDAAVGGDADGRVDLLPTPTQSDGTGGGIRTGLSWEGTTQSTGDGGNSRLRDVVGLLLPTPRTRDGKGGTESRVGDNKHDLPSALLPTPRSSDCFGAGQHGDGGLDLRTTVTLLPTPSTFDGGGSTLHPDRRKEINPKHSPELSELARHSLTQWGKYEPAIRRWEQIVGPAPAPTEPNRNGKPRLKPAFAEWMMGWPPGWVTDPDIGISRNDQLKIIGNGVVSTQAEAAVRYLLSVLEVDG